MATAPPAWSWLMAALVLALLVPPGLARSQTIPDECLPPIAPVGPASADQVPATRLLPGFAEDVVVDGLLIPTAFAFLPDGGVLIAEKHGIVRLWRDGVLRSEPFLDIQSQVNIAGDRGVLAIAVDPLFVSNGYVYLFYVYEGYATDFNCAKTSRLSRFTASTDRADPASEHVLLGTETGPTCDALPPGADCLAADAVMHSGGMLRFAADGSLFVSTGDGSFLGRPAHSLRAQDLDLLAGKLLHVGPDGQGLPSNPFWTGDPSANRSKVWAYGLRNPWRFSLQPGTELPIVADVGNARWEELDAVPAGANLGWPCYEGRRTFRRLIEHPLCLALYDAGTATPPVLVFEHDGSTAIIGGAFYTGGAFPQPYRGAYFYAELVEGTIWSVSLDEQGRPTADPLEFATRAPAPVAIEPGPDESLYYLSITTGELRRIRYLDQPEALGRGSTATGPGG